MDTNNSEILYRISWKVIRKYRNKLTDDFSKELIQCNEYMTLFDSIESAIQYYYRINGIDKLLRYRNGSNINFSIYFGESEPVYDIEDARMWFHHELYFKRYVLTEVVE